MIARGVLTAAMLLASVPPSMAQAAASAVTFRADTMGCADLDTYRAMARTVARDDREAFIRLLLPAVTRGECRFFKRGDPAFHTAGRVVGDAVCVRPMGEVPCFWVPVDATGP